MYANLHMYRVPRFVVPGYWKYTIYFVEVG